MLETHRGASGSAGALLLLLYLLTAFSDLLDGYFARRAGTASAKWGRLDVLADVWFNASALLAAAWLGLVGYWVPLGVAALAAQFLHRNRSAPAVARQRLREDIPGKAAGVIYYLLVGAVATGVWLDPDRAPDWLGWAGDTVFVYTALVFTRNVWRKASSKPSSVRP